MSEPFLSVFPSFVGFVSVFCFDTLHVAHHVDRFFRASSFVSLDHSTPRRLFFHLFFFSSGWYATPSTSDPSVPSFRRIDPRTTRSVSSNPTLLPASCAMSRGDPRACNPVGGGPSSPSSSSRPSPGSNARPPPHSREKKLSWGRRGRTCVLGLGSDRTKCVDDVDDKSARRRRTDEWMERRSETWGRRRGAHGTVHARERGSMRAIREGTFHETELRTSTCSIRTRAFRSIDVCVGMGNASVPRGNRLPCQARSMRVSSTHVSVVQGRTWERPLLRQGRCRWTVSSSHVFGLPFLSSCRIPCMSIGGVCIVISLVATSLVLRFVRIAIHARVRRGRLHSHGSFHSP